jgi:hypothetical protein
MNGYNMMSNGLPQSVPVSTKFLNFSSHELSKECHASSTILKRVEMARNGPTVTVKCEIVYRGVFKGFMCAHI